MSLGSMGQVWGKILDHKALGGRFIYLCTFTRRDEEEGEAEETWHINSEGGNKQEAR